MIFTLNILRDKIHRTRTIQGNTSHHIFQILGAQFLHEALHPGTFQLEHTFRSTGADGSQYFRIVIVNGIHIYVSAGGILNKFYRIMDHSQCTQPQEIHFQQSQFFQCRHGKLGDDGTVGASGQRHEFIRRLLTDDHARRMHGGMSGQSFQTLTHIDQMMHLLILLIKLSEFRVHFQRFTQGDVQFIGHHLGNGIHERIGQIHNTSHITDDTLGCQGTERNDLHHLVVAVFSAHIIDDFLSPFEAEVHINIGHGHTFRIQETFKQQIIMNGINVGDLQTICHDTSRSGTSSRSHRNPVLFRIVDEIPYDQEIVHISHSADDTQLVIQTFPQGLSGLPGRLVTVTVTLCQSVITKLVQIAPGIITFRHIVFRQLRHAKLYLHITTVCNPLGILHGLPCIGEQSLHFLFALDVILTALITHAILVRQLFAGLQTQQNIVGNRILSIGVMHIVGGYQRNVQFSAHLEQFHVHCPLFRDSMILQFQKIIALAEAGLVFASRFSRFVLHSLQNKPGHFTCKAGRQCDNSLVELLQHFHVHTGFIIISFRKATADDFHQIRITGIILCQQHQMMIAILSAGQFFVKTGIRRHIHLAAQDWLDAGFPCGTVKIDYTVHDTMVGNCRTVHSQLFDSGHILFDLIGSIQQRIFCMNMKMCKCHFAIPFLVQFFCSSDAFLVDRSHLFSMITGGQHCRKMQCLQRLFLCRCRV